jgi:iron complex outermembrane recepter protein
VRSTYRALFCGTSALALASLCGGVALAQDDASGDDIVVTGIRASMRDSLDIKRTTALVSDNISTEDIGVLPDVTIAEELNRLPGINTTRDRGNASQASVRGMGPRLVFGLLNGRDLASTEPSQAVRWEVFPSEVLSGVQVYKSQDASIIPGGIAATIDIRTIRPLDHDKTMFSVRAGPSYQDGASDLPHYDAYGYRGSFGYVTHLSPDVAIALAGSLQRTQNGYPGFETWGWNTEDTGSPSDLNGDGTPDHTTWGLATNLKEIQQDRKSMMGAIGWKATPELTVNADLLYSRYEISEDQFQTWYGNDGGCPTNCYANLGNWAGGSDWIYNAPGNSYDVVDGAVVAGNFQGANSFDSSFNYQSEIARYNEDHTMWAEGLNLAWSEGLWDLTADLSHSEARRENRWEAIYLTSQGAPNLQFDLRGKPSSSISGADPADPNNQTTSADRNGQSDGPWNTRDILSAIALDGQRHFEGDFFKGLQFGIRASQREKSVRRFSFPYCSGVGSISPGADCAASGGTTIALTGLERFNLDSYFQAPDNIWGNYDTLVNQVYPNRSVPADAQLLGSSGDVEERMSEAYGKINFGSDLAGVPMTGSLGVRVTHVNIDSSGYEQLNGGPFTPVKVSNDYTEVLPSLNLVFDLTDDQVLRFGAGKAIARPPLDALYANFNLFNTTTPGSGGGGNPLLEPYRSTQVDLSWEWYFHDESLLALAAFYKDITNFIGASSSTQVIDGFTYIIGSESNGKGGEIHGLEATFQTRLFFLPGPLENFGIYANYAYGDSDIHEFAPASNPYTMVGLTDSTGEFDVFYNNGGFEARVAYKRHGAFTFAPGWDGTSLLEEAPEETIDASVSYDFGRWSVRLNGRNLNNEPSRTSLVNNPVQLGVYDVFGRTFLLDVAYKY